jgi:hypothetical protein
MRRKNTWHVCKRREVHTGFWWANLKARGHFNDLGVDGSILLQFILKKSVGWAWTGFIWLTMGIRGGEFLK